MFLRKLQAFEVMVLLFIENSEVVLGDFNQFNFLPGAANGCKWCILPRATNST
jgi:hypothetical protein